MNLSNNQYSKRVYKRLLSFLGFVFALYLISFSHILVYAAEPYMDGNKDYIEFVSGGFLYRVTWNNSAKLYVYNNNVIPTINGEFYNLYSKSTGSWQVVALNYSLGQSTPPTGGFCGLIIDSYLSSSVVVYNSYLLTQPLYSPPVPFTGDANYNLVSSPLFEGLLITNPYDTITLTNPKINVIAQSRITTGVFSPNDLLGGIAIHESDDIKKYATDNVKIYINDVLQSPFVTSTLVWGDDGKYVMVFNAPLVLKGGVNKIKFQTDFYNGGFLNNRIFTNSDIRYSNTITLYYNEFVPTTTTVTSPDGTITNTTTTPVTPTNPNAIPDVEVINPNGVVTFTPGDIIVLPSTVINYEGPFKGVQKALDTIVSYIAYPFVAIGNAFVIIFDSMTDTITGFGDFVPFLKIVFDFLPPKMVSLLTMGLSFAVVGLFLRTFGRK